MPWPPKPPPLRRECGWVGLGPGVHRNPRAGRCGLSELDGLSALPELQELYLSFNDIAHLSPLTTLEELQARPAAVARGKPPSAGAEVCRSAC